MNISSSTSSQNYLPFSINGVEKVRVDSTGFLGVGTTAPTVLLDVSGAAKVRGALDMTNQKITNLAAPTVSTDVSSKGYVDGVSAVFANLGASATSDGGANTRIGAAALSVVTGGNNTAIGASAGATVTSGTQNVYVGSLAAASSATATNEIAIGYNVAGLGSNTAVIGNSSTATTVLRGNVGIGTTAPAATLDVSGAAKFRATLDMTSQNIINASQIQASTNLALQPTSGNVGIGTTTPAYKLDVNGTINCTGNILRNGSVYTGKIIDITQSVINYALDYTPGTTWTDSPIPSITITPFSSSSRFLLRANIVFCVSPTTTVAFRFVRSGNAIGVGSGGTYQCTFRGQISINNTQWANTTSGEYMDSPNTTSSITYKIQFISFDSSRTVRFNDAITGEGVDRTVGISTLTITELLS